MRRVSPRLIALRAVDAVKVYVPFMLLQGGVAERLPQWLHLPWTLLVIYYSATRVQVLLFDWLTTRFAVTGDGISLQTGWPTRQVAFARWSEISALSIDQDLSHRLIGASRIRAVIGAEGREDLLLEAMDADQVARVRALYAEHSASGRAAAAAAAAESPTASAAGTVPGTLIYSASLRDKALISLTHAKFLLIIPFVLGAYNDLAEPLRLPSGTGLIEQVLSGDPTVLAAAVALAFAFGFVRASITFHDFRVSREGSRFVSTGGLFHHQAREADLSRVVGVRLSQNVLMRVVGCSRLSLVVDNARGEFRTFVVLPVATNDRARGLAHELMSADCEVAAPPRPRPGLSICAATVSTLISVMLLWHGLPWFAASTLALGVVLADRWYAAFAPVALGSLSHRRGWLATRHYLLRLSSARSATSWHLPAGLRTSLLRVTVMDRRPVGLWGARTPTTECDELGDLILLTNQGANR